MFFTIVVALVFVFYILPLLMKLPLSVIVILVLAPIIFPIIAYFIIRPFVPYLDHPVVPAAGEIGSNTLPDGTTLPDGETFGGYNDSGLPFVRLDTNHHPSTVEPTSSKAVTDSEDSCGMVPCSTPGIGTDRMPDGTILPRGWVFSGVNWHGSAFFAPDKNYHGPAFTPVWNKKLSRWDWNAPKEWTWEYDPPRPSAPSTVKDTSSKWRW